ncbi:PREDICTED: uncharacterized protein LOC105563367 [Vollenhovia emeryi]|uniref:uncharacterized protein LOC105563367 n=1 Tax=Vollenhovia emeryi TaxID=411798 RepID=UPI0005F37BBD|nr:PREDICTED: uncharacterized protein LOC105563367 [Vollenhovia emeryi]
MAANDVPEGTKIESVRELSGLNNILLREEARRDIRTDKAGCRWYQRTADKGTPTFIGRAVCYFPQRWKRYAKITVLNMCNDRNRRPAVSGCK